MEQFDYLIMYLIVLWENFKVLEVGELSSLLDVGILFSPGTFR